MKKVFIDGSAGTTGLRINERLASRGDITLLSIAEEVRKDPAARAKVLNEADVVFLCLPDDAAIESASLVTNPDTAVIDTSTAHRVDPEWTFGFPELSGMRDKIKASKRIANPGCHASGFIVLVAPLIEAGLLSKDEALSCFSLTGYSGGGKKMIAQYEDPSRDPLLDGPRFYSIAQKHKHIPEMTAVCGLSKAPVFCPIVDDFYAGMEVVVPLFTSQLKGSVNDVKKLYQSCYSEGLVHYQEASGEGGFLSAAAFAGRDDMEVSVYGNEERITLVSRFDNLGKGASGAAIQNMNLLLGVPETTGLVVPGQD